MRSQSLLARCRRWLRGLYALTSLLPRDTTNTHRATLIGEEGERRYCKQGGLAAATNVLSF